MFWTSTAEITNKVVALERKLLKIAQQYASRPSDSWELTTLDTQIPRKSIIALKQNVGGGYDDDDDDEILTIHSVHVVSKESASTTTSTSTTTTKTPLVMLHGYMNGGAYFYRNFGGLSNYFQSIYAVDMLGWGLSSRPSFDEVIENGTTKSAEDFFVESLEAWRSVNNIDRMVLAGHSFGGYMSVAYAERYPTRVERLILISPVGVPDHQDPNVLRRMETMQSSYRGRAFSGLFQTIFGYMTPGGILRTLTESRGSTMSRNYIERRLPEISDVDESRTVADYLYWNAALPPSGESFLQSVLTPLIVLAKEPLLFRIPNLKVKSVTFMYGSTDWMDLSGGMYTKGLCEKLSEKDYTSSSSSTSSTTHHIPPKVDVFVVPKAGHLLMLQNPEATNACIVHAAGGKVLDEEMPELMKLSKSEEELNESWIKQTLKLREGTDDTTLHEDRIKTALKLNMQ